MNKIVLFKSSIKDQADYYWKITWQESSCSEAVFTDANGIVDLLTNNFLLVKQGFVAVSDL